MTNAAASCTIIPSTVNCSCGATYVRVKNPRYNLSCPVCPDCGSTPSAYSIRKKLDGHCQEFSYDAKGRRIRTLDDCHRVSVEVHYDILAGTFDKRKYKKRTAVTYISDTIADFVEEKIFPNQKRLPFTHEDKTWMEDYMVPYLADVGVFVVSKVHLIDFIRTFKLKGEDKERAERLFNMVVGQIRL